jgi:pimeloyl-ACP methyl ester carboxylesterase
LDLPGLGDSDGVIPADMLEFVNRGGYSPVLSATLKELVERFSLSGVIIVGLCAGAVSALYAAAISRQCRGLVLLDPYFHLPQGRTKLREELSAWAARSALGTLMSNILDRLKHLGTLLRGNRLPKNANLPLLRCVAQLASAGMPVLMMKAPAVKAPGLKPRAGQFDYLSYVQKLSCRRSRIVVEFIEGTNHSFADAIGRVKVRRHTERWLNAHFPKTKREQAALKTLGQEEDNDNDDKNQESCSYR